jgi:tetratricopeptide (TPR) repeat protein
MAGGNSELSCRGLQAVAMAQLGLREYQAANASLERALAISCARSPVLQLLLRTSLAEVHRGKGNRERARRELDQSRETLTMVPRGVERTRYLRCRAIVARNFAQPDEASGYFEDALAEAAEGGQFRARGDILAALGHFYLVGGHGDPVPVFEEAVEIAEALGNSRQLGYLHGELGTAHLDQGNRESAGKHFERGLELSIRSGDEFVTGIAYGNLGALAHRQGHLDDAIDRYRQCLEQLGQTDAAFAEAFFTSLMAGALAERGDLTRARHQLDLARSIDVGPAFVDERNAVLGLQDGQLEVAEARRAQERGDPDAQAEHRSAVETILATPVPRTENTSLLQALLSQAYARLVADSASQWYIAADGREFRAPGMETVDISRRKLLRALLRALVERRLSDPDQPLSFEELAAAGWPGEAFDRVGGSKNRINVALVRLRKAGLEDLLARRPGGYLLDPDQPVTTEAR